MGNDVDLRPAVQDSTKRFFIGEILVLRSIFCITVSLVIAGSRVWKTNLTIKLAGLLVGTSSIAFYRAVYSLGVNPVVVILTFTPVVNMVLVLLQGKRVSYMVTTSIVCLIAGTCWAIEPWNQSLSFSGISWAFTCVLMSGLGFHLWGSARDDVTVSEKAFWLSVWVFALALPIVVFTQLPVSLGKYYDFNLLIPLLAFGFAVTGYMFCSIVPYSRVGKMNTVTASVLTQAGTPFTILGAFLIVGEKMAFHQLLGVVTALTGAIFLSIQTIRAAPPEIK